MNPLKRQTFRVMVDAVYDFLPDLTEAQVQESVTNALIFLEATHAVVRSVQRTEDPPELEPIKDYKVKCVRCGEYHLMRTEAHAFCPSPEVGTVYAPEGKGNCPARDKR